MIIIFSLLFPILAIIVLNILHKKMLWWEILGLFLTVIISIVLTKFIDESLQTNDVEYIQDYVVRVEYYEDWDEWIQKKCYKENCTGTGNDRKCHTEYYDCSYVDYHDEYWVIKTASGKEYNITKDIWLKLKTQFDATPIFVDMHRDYYYDDGDMYYYVWDGNIESVEYFVSEHVYENRVQASHNVVNFKEVDTTSIRNYSLFEYPTIKKYKMLALLGDDNIEIDNYINKTNALYAINKQVKVFYLIFKNQPLDAALLQEQYWKGGNKNEIIICIGIDNNRVIKWSYVFSWSKSENVKISIRDYINKQKKLDTTTYKNIVDFSNKEIVKKYTRFRFREFSYLNVELSNSAVVISFLVSFLISVAFTIYIIKSRYE
jgi:hypothetical protein